MSFPNHYLWQLRLRITQKVLLPLFAPPVRLAKMFTKKKKKKKCCLVKLFTKKLNVALWEKLLLKSTPVATLCKMPIF